MSEISNRSQERVQLNNQTVKDLAEKGGFWQLLSNVRITPGYNPFAHFTGISHPDYPPDKYTTMLELSYRNVVEVLSKQAVVEEPIEPKKLESRGIAGQIGRLLSWRNAEKNIEVASKLKTYYIVIATIEESDGADISCSPNQLTEEMGELLDTGYSITLAEDISITPDYSNLEAKTERKILTTPDLYSIVIRAGTELVVRRGGQIGNIIVDIIKGQVGVVCNGDIELGSVKPFEDVSKPTLSE